MADAFLTRAEQPLAILDKVDEDISWVSQLPEGCTVTSTNGHGASYWTRSARVDVQLLSGEAQTYFLKLATGQGGKVMVRGEYESMRALFQANSEMVPRPISNGTFESDPNTHFFLCEFRDMSDELPDPVEFCEKLAELHRRSMGQSTNGMFGFDVITCNGKVPQYVSWHSSWETFYIESMKHEFALEEEVQGPCPEIQELLPALYEKVCPRLLRPLETEGNVVKPCLVHGDLWDGNTGIDLHTDKPYIFDSSAFWAHNEYDLACWRGARYRMRRTYIKEYFNQFPISPPVEDWDDRNLLYSVRADLHDSILYPSTKKFRDLIITSLRQLTEKFPLGYEGIAVCKDTETGLAERQLQPEDTSGTHESSAGRHESNVTADLDGNMSAENNLDKNPIHEEELISNFHQDSIPITPNEPALMQSLSPVDNVSEVGVGESAISPRSGSVINSG